VPDDDAETPLLDDQRDATEPGRKRIPRIGAAITIALVLVSGVVLLRALVCGMVGNSMRTGLEVSPCQVSKDEGASAQEFSHA